MTKFQVGDLVVGGTKFRTTSNTRPRKVLWAGPDIDCTDKVLVSCNDDHSKVFEYTSEDAYEKVKTDAELIADHYWNGDVGVCDWTAYALAEGIITAGPNLRR